MLVHDPTPFAAFHNLLPIESKEAFLSASLFREKPDPEELHRQHANFVQVLKEHVPVMYLSEILGNLRLPHFEQDLRSNPNYIFTHDAIITIPWVPGGYILGNMRRPLRRDEPTVLAEVAQTLGYEEILKLPPELYLEGGDVMPLCHDGRRLLLMGYGPRTTEQTLFYFQQTLVQDGLVDEVIGVRLAPWRLNLDGCFFPVSKDTIVAHPGSILDGIRLGRGFASKLEPVPYFREIGFDIIEATREESYFQQACNFACVAARKLVAYNMTDRINKALRARSVEVISVEGDELVKGNGGPHCMTRPFYGV
jgi:N-dimethylarginine dimethylaminohydrolase